MPRVSLQTGYAQQPQHAGAKPNWGNPLTAGLKMLTSFGNVRAAGGAVDAVTNTPWTPSGTTAIGNLQKGGKVVQFTGGSNGQLQNAASLATLLGTADHTILLLASITDTSRNSVLVSGNATSGAYCNSNNGKWSYNDAATNATTVTTGKIDVVFFLQSGGNKQVVQNNNYSATAASAAAGFSAGNTSLGNYGLNGGFTPGGAIALFAVWKRVLSPTEISELTANPWQLFKAQSRDVGMMMLALGAPGSSTYNLGVGEAGTATDAPNRDGSSSYSVAQQEAGATVDTVSPLSVLGVAAVEALTGSDSVNTGSPPVVTLKQHWYQPVSVGNAGMALTFGTNPMTTTSGATLIAVWTGSDNQSMPPPTDSAGTFTVPTGGIISAAGSNNIWLGMAHQANAAGGSHTMTPHTVNVGGNGELGIWIFEVLNMPTTPTVRGVYSQTTVTSVSTWTVTTDSAPLAGDFAICAATYENTVSYNPSDLSDPPSGGWTAGGHAEQNGDVFIPTTVAYQVVPSSGAISSTWSTSDPTVSEHLAMILVMAPLTAGGGSTYGVTAAESGTSADAPTSIASMGVAQVEAGTGVEAAAAARVTAAATTEAGTASDTDAASNVQIAVLAEAGVAVDADAAASVTVASTAEASTATDVTTISELAATAITEAGLGVDLDSASTSTSGATAEVGTATALADVSSSAAQEVDETLTAADVVGVLATLATMLAELLTAADIGAAGNSTAAALTDAGTANDSAGAAAVANLQANDSGTAADAVTQAGSSGASLTEASAVTDQVINGSAATNVATTEALAAADTHAAVALLLAATVEAAAAAETGNAIAMMGITLSELLNALDATTQGASSVQALTDAGTVVDVVSVQRLVFGLIADVLTAADTDTVSAQLVAQAMESGNVADLALAAAVLGGELQELANSVDNSDALAALGVYNSESLAATDTAAWVHIAFTLLRTFTFAAESRSYAFQAESRSMAFPAENRSFPFTPESRSYPFQETPE